MPLVPKLESTTSARVKAWKKKPLRLYSTGTDEREDHQSIQRRRSNERKRTPATRKRQGSCTRCRGTGELTFKGFQQERRHKSLKSIEMPSGLQRSNCCGQPKDVSAEYGLAAMDYGMLLDQLSKREIFVDISHSKKVGCEST